MPITVTCPSCGRSMTAPDSLAGQKLKCPGCGKGIAVSGLPQAKVNGPPRPATNPSMGSDCPSCESYLPPGSVICIHCGLDLRTGRKIARPKGKSSKGLVLAFAGLAGAAVLAAVFFIQRSHKKEAETNSPAQPAAQSPQEEHGLPPPAKQEPARPQPPEDAITRAERQKRFLQEKARQRKEAESRLAQAADEEQERDRKRIAPNLREKPSRDNYVKFKGLFDQFSAEEKQLVEEFEVQAGQPYDVLLSILENLQPKNPADLQKAEGMVRTLGQANLAAQQAIDKLEQFRSKVLSIRLEERKAGSPYESVWSTFYRLQEARLRLWQDLTEACSYHPGMDFQKIKGTIDQLMDIFDSATYQLSQELRKALHPEWENKADLPEGAWEPSGSGLMRYPVFSGEERSVAVWVVSQGGRLFLLPYDKDSKRYDRNPELIVDPSQVPQKPFRIQQITLARKQITSADLERIGKLPSLNSIDLQYTNLTDEGLAILARDNKNWLKIDVRFTSITDAGLEPLKKLPALAEILLVGTRVTAAGVTHLKEALPTCQVVGP